MIGLALGIGVIGPGVRMLEESPSTTIVISAAFMLRTEPGWPLAPAQQAELPPVVPIWAEWLQVLAIRLPQTPNWFSSLKGICEPSDNQVR